MIARTRTYRRLHCALVALIMLGMSTPYMSVHYCGGHFAGVSIQTVKGLSQAAMSSCAERCGAEKEKGCCEDVAIDAEEHHEQYTSQAPSLEVDLIAVITPIEDLTLDPPSIEQEGAQEIDRGPPKPSGAQLRILYQSFLC